MYLVYFPTHVNSAILFVAWFVYTSNFNSFVFETLCLELLGRIYFIIYFIFPKSLIGYVSMRLIKYIMAANLYSSGWH